MYKYILESASNINWMAVFALMTFLFVFSMSTYLAFVKDKESLKRLANLPLENDDVLGED